MLQGRSQPLREKLGNNQYRHVQERPSSPGAPPSYFEITILDEHELPDYGLPDYGPDYSGAHRDHRPTPRSGEEMNRSGGSRERSREVSQERIDAYGHAGKEFARGSMARSSASPPRVVSGMRERSPATMSNGLKLPPKPSMLVYDDVPPDAWVSEFDPVDEDDNEYKVVIDDEEEYRLYQEFKRRYQLEQEQSKGQEGGDTPIFTQLGAARTESLESQKRHFDSLLKAPPPRRRSELVDLQSVNSRIPAEGIVEELQWNPAALASQPASPRGSEASLQVRGPPGRRNVQMPTAMEQAAAREQQIAKKQQREAGEIAAVSGSSRARGVDIPHKALGKEGMPAASASRGLDLSQMQPGQKTSSLRAQNLNRASSFKRPEGNQVTTITMKVRLVRSAMKKPQQKLSSMTKSSKKSDVSLREPVKWEESVVSDIVQALNDVEMIVRNDQIDIRWNEDPDPDVILIRISDSVDAGPMVASARVLADRFIELTKTKGTRLRQITAQSEHGAYDIVMVDDSMDLERRETGGIPAAIPGAPTPGVAKPGKKNRRGSALSDASRPSTAVVT